LGGETGGSKRSELNDPGRCLTLRGRRSGFEGVDEWSESCFRDVALQKSVVVRGCIGGGGNCHEGRWGGLGGANPNASVGGASSIWELSSKTDGVGEEGGHSHSSSRGRGGRNTHWTYK